jgi:hypothetical protein
MPADLTREEIERMRDLAAMLDTEARATMTEFGQAERLLRAIGRVGPQWVALVDSALSEPTRLAQARAEGCREGIEAAIADAVAVSIRDEVDSYEMRDDGGGGYSPTDDERIMLEDFGEGLLSIMQTRLRALSPPPAEPAQPDDGWIEWKGDPHGQCPVVGRVEVRHRDGRVSQDRSGNYWWGHDDDGRDIISYRIVKPASAPVAEDFDDKDMAAVGRSLMEAIHDNRTDARLKHWMPADGPAEIVTDMLNWLDNCDARIAALEAENAALKARNAELVEGLRPFAEEADEWEGINVRAGDGDPVFIGPDDVMDAGKARFSVGDLRRARALLQGQGGGDA